MQAEDLSQWPGIESGLGPLRHLFPSLSPSVSLHLPLSLSLLFLSHFTHKQSYKASKMYILDRKSVV